MKAYIAPIFISISSRHEAHFGRWKWRWGGQRREVFERFTECAGYERHRGEWMSDSDEGERGEKRRCDVGAMGMVDVKEKERMKRGSKGWEWGGGKGQKQWSDKYHTDHIAWCISPVGQLNEKPMSELASGKMSARASITKQPTEDNNKINVNNYHIISILFVCVV